MGQDRPPLLVLLLLVACAATSFAAEQTYVSKWECHVNDPLSCDQAKSEVCTFRDGSYACDCPPGVSRLPDGRCLMINECLQTRLNDCHENARCIDKSEGYTCECKAGFADISEHPDTKPGRICTSKLNECLDPYTNDVDCSPNADCVDTPDWFTCKCHPGFTDISATLSKLPGRKCIEIANECVTGKSDCSANADCIDQQEGYLCKCRAGFVDVSANVTHFPGRQCTPVPTEPKQTYKPRKPQCDLSSHSCGPNEQCKRDYNGEYRCQCIEGARQTYDGVCRVFDHCEHTNECDRNAVCSNAYDNYKCQCKSGYKDISPDPLRHPGRKCQLLVNECADRTHTCSPYARCEDTQEGYLCHCNNGYTDVSSRYGLQPGRKCAQANNYCGERDLNSCDENADCVNLPDGYTCKCFDGYADVSSNANLPPGRVCTLQTTCPAQPTDLFFVIDGSGSIGSQIFQSDVLRFVSEFVELFDIGSERTRVGVLQYSDRIRHEFELNAYSDIQSLKRAIASVEYLTGLTRTGAAIEHVVGEAFTERHGSRPVSQGVARVAIVITDGRSQDNVTIPANNARAQKIQLFAVGVTSHVLDEELETISGSKSRTFHVSGFKDLNARLRSAIQKVTCPEETRPPPTPVGPCDSNSHKGCDRSMNQVCTNGRCTCPAGFDLNPVTQECGGVQCDPKIISSCPHPEICQRTPFGNYRCECPNGQQRHPKTGACKSSLPPTLPSTDEDECGPGKGCGENEECQFTNGYTCQCKPGFIRNPGSEKCQLPGQCDPSIPESCDLRKKEQCLPDLRSPGTYTCQCPPSFARHPVTEMCLINECLTNQHQCSPNALCTDTDDGYLCSCKYGYIDESPDPTSQPGRVCRQQVNECLANTHNCSINALCIDLPDGFLCRCKPDFVDFSPNPQQFGGVDCRPLVDECANPALNTCHHDAICIDTRDGYTCQCKEGFLDQDALRNPGRDCRRGNQLCESGKHDCDKNARCIERGTNDYVCVCNAGFLDKSPDPAKRGRKCLEGVCFDKTKNDCHPAAICTEISGGEGYTCKCRDGYVEQNPTRPGRQCKELVNECLDSTLNDCDPLATCHDMEDGYTCVCPLETKDVSPDQANKPGRKCFALVNECRNPHLNNCSRFADCLDKEEGYECRCKAEYNDNDPAHPGTNCSFITDECQSDNLNDCHKHAKCIDTREGYTCQCEALYTDAKPETPGRVCLRNECADPKLVDCDENADCIDTDDGYVCQCKQGFYDDATDPKKAGRECIALITNKPPQAEQSTTLNPNLIACGNTHCHLDRNEVCIGGAECGCRPNQGRELSSDPCIDVEKTPIEIRVVSKGPDDLVYSSEYGSPNKPSYVEIVDIFQKGIKGAIGKTSTAPHYVNTIIDYITNPKVENPDWDKGLLFNGSVVTKVPLDKCKFWQELVEAIKDSGFKLGNTELIVAKDVNELDPCKPEPQKGTPCGSSFCNPALGEECIAGRLCGCPSGQKRANPEDKCREVESWQIPIYVIREGHIPIKYTPSFANPQDDNTKKYSKQFEKGLKESYAETPLKKSFVTMEVNEIARPDTLNKTWADKGLLYKFTTYFTKGGVESPEQVVTDLHDYIIKKNHYEVGKSNLFINPEQPNPFSVCYNSDCHPDAICKADGASGYTCECRKGFRDLDASNPGHTCVAIHGFNECEHKEHNDCAPEARCIDLDYLYKCECVKPYVDAAEKGQTPGSVCRLDQCSSDPNLCPANTTCINGEQAYCECKRGFMDIRKAENRHLLGLDDAFCLLTVDVDECALGLHNCSSVAHCTNLPVGYRCECPEGYTDGNPGEPGRVCAAPATSCGHCNGHGDCIHLSGAQNITCECAEGWTGERCAEAASSSAASILLILLALLFLLLMLLCCLWACFHTRCFGWGQKRAASTGFTDSDYQVTTIPRAKLKPMDGGAFIDGGHMNQAWDGASISSGTTIEEVERRVTTDVTTREIRTTTVDGAVAGHEERNALYSSVHPSGVQSEAEQFATMSSDHFAHDVIGASSLAHRADSSYSQSQRGESAYAQGAAGSAHHYDLDSESISGESDAGNATFDRQTRVNRQHDYFPGPNGAVERRRNEYVTTTTAKETNYF